jgi:hypothetical protein
METNWLCKLMVKSEIWGMITIFLLLLFTNVFYRQDYARNKEAVQKMLIDLVCMVNIKAEKARA